jgi:prepilin-type N-terminal cleavage/methylation domain-containing protein
VTGFSFAELLITVAIIGVITAIAAPTLWTYWQTMTLKSGAQELVGILNRGRQLAITRNGSVCVMRNGVTQIRYHLDTCVGAVWTGPGTDNAGWFTLTNNLQVSAATANVLFTNLGAAAPGGTYTVRNPATAQVLTVTVAGSGRITIP